jgi:predicted extracellular nuclease
MSVTLASMDFNGFTAGGFAPTPAAGQLDSDFWRLFGASDGLVDYGGTATTGDFARGLITTANPTTGGVYAVTLAAGDNAFVLQPTGSDFSQPGTLTLRVQHTGTAPLTSLTFDFEGVFRNNETRAGEVRFDYAVQAASAEPTSFTGIAALGFTTPGAPDTLGFQVSDRPATTVAATVNPGDWVFARWSFSDSGSGARDEIGIDDVLITGTPGTPAATIAITPGNLILAEGNSGTTDFAFTVTRSADNGTGSATLGFVGSAGLDAADIAGITVDGVAVAPADFAAFVVSFATPGDNAVDVVVRVQGDTTPEADETFALALSAPGGAYTIGTPFTATAVIVNDDIALTDISAIQGSGRSSPFAGNGLTYTIEGVVTGDFQNGDADAGRNLQGFFVQMLAGDGDATTSDGIFVFQNDGGTGPLVDVRVGDVVRVTGTVSEFARFSNQRTAELTETQLVVGNSLAGIQVVTAGAFTEAEVQAQFAATVDLPVAGTRRLANNALTSDLESVEGMLVRFDETLTISEMFNLDRFNEFRAILGEQATQFTQNNLPDVAGNALHLADVARRTITVDDGLRVQNAPPTVFGTPIDTASAPQMGDSFQGLIGNVRFSDGSSGASADNLSNATSNATQAFRILPQNAPNIADTQPREPAPGRDGGDVKVATANLLNFFTTLNAGGATTGPGGAFEPRGANNAAELARQQEKLLTALAELDADVLVLNEIENNGFGPGSAIDTLVDLLNDKVFGAAGPDHWTFVDPGTPFLGGDAISVGILYRSDRIALAAGTNVAVLDDSDIPALISQGLLPSGFLAQSTKGAVFNGPDTSRAVLVSTLTEIASGESFTLAAVHNKSKSGIGTGLDADALDGAGNWNNQRLLATQALDAFLKSNPTGVDDADLLLMGDFNSYAREVSIRHLTETAGFRNLVEDRIGADAFSFVFDGQKGYLDYAFASAALAGFVRGVHEWNVNAPEADALDYNLDFGRPAGIFDGTVPWRYSDHDPLVVNLLLDPALTTTRGGQVVAVGNDLQEALDNAQAGDVIRVENFVRLQGLVPVVLAVDNVTVDVAANDGFIFAMDEAGGESDPVTFSLRGSGDVAVIGNNADNTIADASGDSFLAGFDGKDNISGRQGNDTILGGEGNDTLSGGVGNDSLSGGSDDDLIFGDRGNDDLSGEDGNDTLSGGDGEDELLGGEGDDRLLGGLGNDTLNGGGGNDFLRGDGGDDVFLFNSTDAAGRIVIADFDANGNDLVELKGFAGLDDFADIAGRLRQNGTNTILQVEDTRIILRDTMVASLDASDFLFS